MVCDATSVPSVHVLVHCAPGPRDSVSKRRS